MESPPLSLESEEIKEAEKVLLRVIGDYTRLLEKDSFRLTKDSTIGGNPATKSDIVENNAREARKNKEKIQKFLDALKVLGIEVK